MTSDEDSRPALIWCPFASAQEARVAAEALLQEQLVACANIVPEITSVFRYEGEVQSASEVGAVFKTRAGLLDAATIRLAELHPYEVPAICGWLVDSAPPETRAWLAASLAGGGSK